MDHMQDPVWIAALAAVMAVTGLASGTLAGLLGVGGGIVIVPVLFNIFPLLDIPEAVQMKLAVGTSLATIIPTSIMSARKHNAKGAMDVPLLKAMIPSLLVGVVVGTVIAIWVRGDTLTAVFAAVALLVALNMGFTGVDARWRETFPTGFLRQVLGVFIGGISAMMGIGGGTVGVPLMNIFGTPIRSAVATSSAFGIIISIPAAIGFIYAGWGNPLLPPASIGYVNLIGFALIVPSSMIATPWGVHLAHTISPLALKRAFAVFLGITSIRMIYSLVT
ncbi:sulfite exporter TauE/SafE family protein [Roseomonas sp. SSH11]|uniref:Probable membrane transporter protein n=1 Tax=Pararoseomonas baculiformis TaxID=2820812 RepID=A0ABS4A9N3_9PROT|nr:sulfite exporter TauE/SafE family protein [Pararoseomonas baculiformis]MBP0443699.1 sulfite exporter TauE/SafE family protein [Pararoseomonas baculiformis]